MSAPALHASVTWVEPFGFTRLGVAVIESEPLLEHAAAAGHSDALHCVPTIAGHWSTTAGVLPEHVPLHCTVPPATPQEFVLQALPILAEQVGAGHSEALHCVPVIAGH